MMEPAELSSLKSLLRITRIIALVFLIIWLIAALALIGLAVVAIALGAVGGGLFGAGLVLIWTIVNIIIYMQIGEIRRMVDAGQYQPAKEKTLIWMILGFILGGVIIGILLLVCWLKFDPVINWQRQMQSGGGQPAWTPPQAAAPAYGAPAAPAQPAAAAPPATPTGATCPRCGKPATWVAQYSRWYCYSCQQYL